MNSIGVLLHYRIRVTVGSLQNAHTKPKPVWLIEHAQYNRKGNFTDRLSHVIRAVLFRIFLVFRLLCFLSRFIEIVFRLVLFALGKKYRAKY